jgi:hypothetical protein
MAAVIQNKRRIDIYGFHFSFPSRIVISSCVCASIYRQIVEMHHSITFCCSQIHLRSYDVARAG